MSTTSEQNERLLREWLRMMAEKDMDGFASLWVEDVVQENPYAPDGFPRFFRGREEIVHHYTLAALEVHGYMEFSEITFHHSASDTFWAEFDGRMNIVATDREYDNKYAFRITVKDGRMAYVKEYFNPLVLLDSFDDSVDLMNKEFESPMPADADQV